MVRNPLNVIQNLERVQQVDHQKRLNASDFQRQSQLTVREIEDLRFNILSGNYPTISHISTVHSSFFSAIVLFSFFFCQISYHQILSVSHPATVEIWFPATCLLPKLEPTLKGRRFQHITLEAGMLMLSIRL